jgi:hypothetical protein
VLPLTKTEAFMDLSYLYQRHQISLVMGEHGSSDRVCRVHGGFANLYAVRIAEARQPGTPLRGT